MKSDLKQYWQPIINELFNSGLSRRKFALEKNLPQTKLNYWAHKLKNKTKSVALKNEKYVSKFIPVQISPIEKDQKNLPDPKWLASFIKEIYRSC